MQEIKTKKTIVLECDITNNGNEPADLAAKANPYTYVHASQKTNNAEKELQPGTIAFAKQYIYIYVNDFFIKFLIDNIRKIKVP